MDSKWGYEEQETIDLIEKVGFNGTVLNFAAGDGRFNNKLLKNCNKVIAIDKNEKDLEKLLRICPLKYRDKLSTDAIDIFKGLPYENETFDGVFCTGTLHSFNLEDIKYIINELRRALKKGGKFIIDFATDIERIKENGELIIYPGEGMYSTIEAEKFIPLLFQKDEIIVNKYTVPEEKLFLEDETPYIFKCNFLLINGIKK